MEGKIPDNLFNLLVDNKSPAFIINHMVEYMKDKILLRGFI